jgi:hypothetical protein
MAWREASTPSPLFSGRGFLRSAEKALLAIAILSNVAVHLRLSSI